MTWQAKVAADKIIKNFLLLPEPSGLWFCPTIATQFKLVLMAVEQIINA